MNKELQELISTFKQILKEYSPDTAPFMLDDEYEVTYSQLSDLLDYIDRLEANWNYLKKNLEKTKCICCNVGGTRWRTYNVILNFMEQLENNVEKLDKLVGDSNE